MSNTDSTTDASQMFATLSSMGSADFTARRQKINDEFTTGFARFVHLVDQGKIPMDVVLRLTAFFDSTAEASVNGRELPALGSSTSDSPTGKGEAKLSDEHKRVLKAYDEGNIPLNLRTGQVRGLERASQGEDGLKRVMRELNVQPLADDSPLDWAERIVDEINKRVKDVGGKTVDTSKLAVAAGLQSDAPIERIQDKIKELAKRPDAQIDLTPIAQALEVKKVDPTVDDLTAQAKDRNDQLKRSADKAREITGLNPDGQETYADFFERCFKQGPKKAGLFGRGNSRSGGRGDE